MALTLCKPVRLTTIYPDRQPARCICTHTGEHAPQPHQQTIAIWVAGKFIFRTTANSRRCRPILAYIPACKSRQTGSYSQGALSSTPCLSLSPCIHIISSQICHLSCLGSGTYQSRSGPMCSLAHHTACKIDCSWAGLISAHIMYVYIRS